MSKQVLKDSSLYQFSSLYLGLLLFTIVGVLIFLIARTEILTGLVEVTMVLAGMFSMAALAFINRFLETKPGPLIHISFDESKSQMVLERLLPKPDLKSQREEVINAQFEPWEPTITDWLASDPTLALAKLRIDIEREVRRLAFESNVTSGFRFASLRRLINDLGQTEVVEPDLIAAIDDVLPVLNQAVHGGDVSHETAASVLKVGEQILTYLRHKSQKKEDLSRQNLEGGQARKSGTLPNLL